MASLGITAKDLALGAGFTIVGIIATFAALFLSPAVNDFVSKRRDKKLSKRRNDEWRQYRRLKGFRTGKGDRYVFYITSVGFAVISAIVGGVATIIAALDERIPLEDPILLLLLVAIVGFLMAGAVLWGINETETRYQNFDEYEKRVREKWGLPEDVEDKPAEISGGAPPQALIDDKAQPERLKPNREGE